MSKDKKSMDDVLDSIRRIIRTDPNAAPLDASTLPPGLGMNDDTAKSVLDRLRKEQDGDDEPARPVSGTTDDPEETAKAVLERLRKETEQTAKAEKVQAAPPDPEPEPEPQAEPEAVLEPVPEDPPAVASDDADVPVLDETTAETPEAPPAAVPQRAAPKAAAPKAAAPDPATMPDAAALEATIRRIVRDELTGEMGRRMTKNVQRMIEAEIERFMADRG